jgi:transmembrane sensor
MSAVDNRGREVVCLQEAAEWLQRLMEAPDDEGVIEAWLDWSRADARNLQAFEEIQNVWQGFDDSNGKRPHAVLSVAPSRRVRFIRRVGLAAGVLMVLIAGLWFAQNLWTGTQYSTGIGEHRTKILPDGSQMELAADSRAWVHYTGREREIRLQKGEAYFTVARDLQRPFTVEAGGLRITAIGTAFDVRRGLSDTVVTVSEGRVRVDPDSGDPSPIRKDSLDARAGEQVVLSARTPRLSVAKVNIARGDTWRRGVLQYVAEPLEEVVADVNRYAPRQVVVEDPAVRRLLFTGTISQTQVDDWLAALQKILPVTVVDRGPDGVLIAPRP